MLSWMLFIIKDIIKCHLPIIQSSVWGGQTFLTNMGGKHIWHTRGGIHSFWRAKARSRTRTCGIWLVVCLSGSHKSFVDSKIRIELIIDLWYGFIVHDEVILLTKYCQILPNILQYYWMLYDIGSNIYEDMADIIRYYCFKLKF